MASVTPALDRELAVLDWRREAIGGGYCRTNAAPYMLYVVSIDEVSQTEHDVLLDLVGHRTMESSEADRWLIEHLLESPEGMTMEKLEGYDELVQKALARMPLSVRLKGLKPEERVSDLSPDERLLVLSDDTLRMFPPEYLETLSAPVREEIRRRLAQRH